MPFSWEQTKKRAIEKKVQRTILLCKSKNPDYVIRHPDEIRDYANGKNVTQLTKRIRAEMKKKQEDAMVHRLKNVSG